MSRTSFTENYLNSILFEFKRYKTLGDATFHQLTDADVLWKYNKEDNCIAQIVNHISGNMLSRWTNFLIEDGEKKWRQRENEFADSVNTKHEMIATWEQGWQCLFTALGSLNSENFDATIKIRSEEHTIVEAINRQLAHYANHIGQIVLLGKMIKGSNWNSLSIPKGGSDAFNKSTFKS